MITNCTKCQARHHLNIGNIDKSTVKFKCKKCGQMNIVTIDSKEATNQDNIAEISTQVELANGNSEGASSPPGDKRPKISGLSIKTKLTLVIVTLIVISLTLVSTIASFKGEETLTQQASTHLNLITGQKAQEYNNIFSRLQDEIEGMVVFAEKSFALPQTPQDLDFKILMPWNGQTYGDAQSAYKFKNEIIVLKHIGIALQGQVKHNPYLELGYMATPHSVMVLDDEKIVDVIAAEKGYVPTKRPWYIDAEKKGKTIWTHPYIDVNTKKLIVSCASPVFDENKKILGVLGFDVTLDTIQQDIIALDIGYDSEAFLLGNDGSMLAKPGMTSNAAWNKAVKTDNALKTENTELKQILTNMVEGKSGVGSHMEGGNKIMISYAPIKAIDASLGIVISQNEVMKPAVTIRKIIMGVWAVVVLLSIFIGLAIGNGITKPINELSYQADLISQGKSGLDEIKTARKDEIGLLVESYNRLIASLKIAISRRRR